MDMDFTINNLSYFLHIPRERSGARRPRTRRTIYGTKIFDYRAASATTVLTHRKYSTFWVPQQLSSSDTNRVM
jgi:hypothetical protein